jgi:hypothetical protein
MNFKKYLEKFKFIVPYEFENEIEVSKNTDGITSVKRYEHLKFKCGLNIL